MHNRIHLRAPATIANVGPGYDIFAMALREPCDEVILQTEPSGNIKIELAGEVQNIPLSPEDNTAGLALLELKKRCNLTYGIKMQIIKHMISGCGLGTTGAAASAAIYGMDKMLGLQLADNERIDVARMGEVASGGSPHADNVAAAMLGGFVLVKNYHPVEVLKLEIPEFPVVLAVIKKSQRTTRGFITYEIGQEKLKDQMARCASVIHAIHTRDTEAFGKAITVDHIAEPVRSAAIPEYAEAKKRILSAGAFGCNISGGGSSVFAICSQDRQQEIAALMEQCFRNNPHFIKVICTVTSNKGIEEMVK